jgi:hypothetical protein
MNKEAATNNQQPKLFQINFKELGEIKKRKASKESKAAIICSFCGSQYNFDILNSICNNCGRYLAINKKTDNLENNKNIQNIQSKNNTVKHFNFFPDNNKKRKNSEKLTSSNDSVKNDNENQKRLNTHSFYINETRKNIYAYKKFDRKEIIYEKDNEQTEEEKENSISGNKNKTKKDNNTNQAKNDKKKIAELNDNNILLCNCLIF